MRKMVRPQNYNKTKKYFRFKNTVDYFIIFLKWSKNLTIKALLGNYIIIMRLRAVFHYLKLEVGHTLSYQSYLGATNKSLIK